MIKQTIAFIGFCGYFLLLILGPQNLMAGDRECEPNGRLRVDLFRLTPHLVDRDCWVFQLDMGAPLQSFIYEHSNEEVSPHITQDTYYSYRDEDFPNYQLEPVSYKICREHGNLPDGFLDQLKANALVRRVPTFQNLAEEIESAFSRLRFSRIDVSPQVLNHHYYMNLPHNECMMEIPPDSLKVYDMAMEKLGELEQILYDFHTPEPPPPPFQMPPDFYMYPYDGDQAQFPLE